MNKPDARAGLFPVPREAMHNLSDYVRHGLYMLLYSVVKYISFPLSNLLRLAVLRIAGCRTASVAISDGVTIWYPWRVRIGRNCSLNQGVIIDGFATVSVGDGVRIAPYCCINTTDHAFDSLEVPIYRQGFIAGAVQIGNDVWIGAGAMINKGVVIGDGCVIGAGAVVTRSLPAGSIAVGVPCRIIGHRRDGESRNP